MKKNDVIQKITSILDLCGRDIPPTPENQEKAKKALIMSLDLIKTVDPPPTPQVRTLLYVEGLEMIFFALKRGNYIEACDETSKFIHIYWTEESHNGLVFLLQKIKDDTFSK